MKTDQTFENKRRRLAALLALLMIAIGYALGRVHSDWQSVLANPRAEDRESFCQLDWMIGDFHAGYLATYFDLMGEFIAEKAEWRRYHDRYEAWIKMHHLQNTPEAWEQFQEEHQPLPSYDPAALAALLTRQLEKLESGSPAPVLIRNLLFLRQELGQVEEHQRLLSWAWRRYPDYSWTQEITSATPSHNGGFVEMLPPLAEQKEL
jgi:hypothetical protein